jgi:uncharacterized protein YndB with AHSA1/START domain
MTNALTVNAPEGLPFIDFEREFDAPVEMVFQAHQDPEMVKQWLGPARFETEIETYDFRTGGRFRFLSIGEDDETYGFNGVYHVVRENELAIQTFEFEGVPDVVSIETLSFEDLGNGRTRLIGHATYPSLEARDGMVQSGMESGMSEGYERLDKVLESLQA